ncbi:fimbrial biogenesis chaperone [Siccibacter turicensis]|uniref:fimbrial biogenesis chaperone n=1 Tax=Siccibacter turicensis TaxID=357233 RepID=UPI000466A06D|nr:molecular chaperone [Siccibacter turicensis]
MRLTLFLIFCLCGTIITPVWAGGVQIGRTRIIYPGDKKEVELALINRDNDLPWLVQSWVDTGDGKTRGPFIITPPLFRLDAQKEQGLRIAWTGAPLATDRESLLFLNVRTIPASEKGSEDKNVLRLIFKTRLKLFFRPAGLDGTPAQSCAGLTFRRTGDRLTVTNAGAFYSVFDSLQLGGHRLDSLELVAPKSASQVVLPAGVVGQNISWRCITDYGNASASHSATLQPG